MTQFYLHNSMHTSSTWLNYAINYFSLFLRNATALQISWSNHWAKRALVFCWSTCLLLVLLLEKVFHLLMHSLELVSVNEVFELFTFWQDHLKFLFLWTFSDVCKSRFQNLVVVSTAPPTGGLVSVQGSCGVFFLPLLNLVVSCLRIFRKASKNCGFAMENMVCDLLVHTGNQ